MKINGKKFVFEGGLLLGIILAFGWLFCFSGLVFHTHEQNTANREAMLRIREAIPIGASTTDVHNAFARFRTPELSFIVDTSGFRLEMPSEASEQAWKLLVDLHNGRVQSLRVRTGDGVPPRDAPADLP